MGYTFKPIPVYVRKTALSTKTKLERFADATAPDLGYFLVNLWRAQGKAITYKELREAIISGEISGEYLEEWMQDYNRFIVKYLQPKWLEAMNEAAKEKEEKYKEWYFNPMSEGVRNWTLEHSAEFVTSVTATQIEGVRAIIQHATTTGMNVDMLARAIRPTVGLYKQQSVSNLKYFTNLIDNGVSEKKALDLAARYGARQHRYRAHMISRHELATAYNAGAHESARQASEAGYMKNPVKVWRTAMSDRTCEFCNSMEGKKVAMDEEFSYGEQGRSYKGTRLYPPAHVCCMCAVEYTEDI